MVFFVLAQNISMYNLVQQRFFYDVSTNTNVCVFGPFKTGSYGGGQQKDIDFSMDLTKPLFVVSLSLGQTQCIIVPSLLDNFFNLQGKIE